MAGIRQHYIPRFLQAGFASRVSEDTTFAWVFRRGQAPYEANSRHTGVERHFYTTLGDSTADDAITAAEGNFAALSTRLKACPAGPVHEPDIPKFIVHLEVRSRHLRESFLATTDYFAKRFLERFSDEDALIAMILKRIEADPVWFRGLFAEELAKRGMNAAQVEAVLDALMPVITPNMPDLLDVLRSRFAPFVHAMKSELPTAMKRAAKDGHIRALKQSIHPAGRVAFLANLNFRVVDVPSVGFVLGDAATLFRVDSTRGFRAYTEKGNAVLAAFLPLAPTRILVGEAQPTQWDWAAIKRQLARCSLEHFIGHENSAENQTLSTEIGVDAAIITDVEMDEIVADSFRGIGRPTGSGGGSQ